MHYVGFIFLINLFSLEIHDNWDLRIVRWATFMLWAILNEVISLEAKH